MVSIVFLTIVMHTFTHESWHSRRSAYNEVFFVSHSQLKHNKSVIARKGQVREVRTQTAPYAGETTGIKSTISRSVRMGRWHVSWPEFHHFSLDAGVSCKRWNMRYFGQTINNLTIWSFALFFVSTCVAILRYVFEGQDRQEATIYRDAILSSMSMRDQVRGALWMTSSCLSYLIYYRLYVMKNLWR